ncbi:MAG: RIO1 family regulatory kinase/ATPase [archaeon]
MPPQIIQQGAEAIILKEGNEIIKRRIKKSYRIKELDDKIRKQRTRSESKLLEKASKFIPIPKIIKMDDKKMEIEMEFIKGKKLSEELNSFPLKEQKQICTQIGKSIAKLHDKDIIHGDLTTSNIILKEDLDFNRRQLKKSISMSKGEVDKGKLGSLYFIDFGLGFNSHRIEDKAVDLHLIKQALEAKHFQNWETLFASIKKGYENSKDSKKILEQLEKVEKRGRYKH